MGKETLTIQENLDGVDLNGNKINLFDFTYPIFDESYREVLNEKIIDHYYFRQIGTQTIAEFKYRLRVKLNEIMPLYNKMYMAQNLEQRILDNYDVTETFTRTNSQNNSNTQTQNESGTNTNKRLFSDTPQSRVDLDSTSYVTDITQDSGTTGNNATINGTATGSASENWTRKMVGNIGIQTDADAVIKYMDSLRNVDILLIDELNELFLGVF
jgi:hypothetical protein